jgi:hypothetical protein
MVFMRFLASKFISRAASPARRADMIQPGSMVGIFPNEGGPRQINFDVL